MESKSPILKSKALEVLRDKKRDINLIGLSKGTYLIDGVIVSVDGYSHETHYVACKDVDDVRLVFNNTITTRYEDAEGNEMSVEDYDLKREQLAGLQNKSLEDEYAYKKFKSVWNGIKKTVQEVSDPIQVRVLESDLLIDNNPNIYSLIYTNDTDETMYMYERSDVIKELLEKEVEHYHKEFGKYIQEFHIDFKLQEKEDLKYIKLDQNYIFGSRYSFGSRKGPKSLIEKFYKQDKALVKSRIKELFESLLPIRMSRILFRRKIDIAKENAKSQETLDFIKQIEDIVRG